MEEGNKEGNFYPQFYKKLYQWYEKHLWAARTVNVLYHLLPALAVLCYVDLLGLVYINGGRIGIGAQAVGIAQGAINEAIKYVKERKQFGKNISKFQNTQFVLADMEVGCEASRRPSV